MKFMVGSEHAGVDYRIRLVNWLRDSGYSVTEVYENERFSEYPEIAEEVALSVIRKECDLGILLCGTGIGMCMAAGKIPERGWLFVRTLTWVRWPGNIKCEYSCIWDKGNRI